MTAANPESGTTAYTYDDSGNVATSQVANGPVRSYSYNTRNQIVAKSYGGTNTPGVIYCYDGKVPAADGSGCAAAGTTILYSNGRLTGVGSSVGMTRYTGWIRWGGC